MFTLNQHKIYLLVNCPYNAMTRQLYVYIKLKRKNRLLKNGSSKKHRVA